MNDQFALRARLGCNSRAPQPTTAPNPQHLRAVGVVAGWEAHPRMLLSMQGTQIAVIR